MNTTYVLQREPVNGKMVYLADSGSEIKWTTNWNYNSKCEKVEKHGAWCIIWDGRIVAALPENVDNPTEAKGSWTIRNGLGQVKKAELLSVEYGVVYLQKSETKNEENVEPLNAEDGLADKNVDPAGASP